MTVKNKKAEAIRRMKMLGVFPETIRQFEEDDKVSISEPPIGAFFWADEEELERIKKFEKNYNAVVYMVIRSFTTIGRLDDYLFVSDYPEEWESDRRDIQEGRVFSYCHNNDMPDCSEMGYIGVASTIAAGLRRTW